MPSPRETNPVAERVLNDRNPVQRSVHPIQKDDAMMRPWINRIVPNLKLRAAATGISAGLLLLGSFTVAVDLGLLPESRRPNAWHWFLGLSMSSLASIGTLTKLDQLQDPQGDRSACFHLTVTRRSSRISLAKKSIFGCARLTGTGSKFEVICLR